jgi:hypothetical protein
VQHLIGLGQRGLAMSPGGGFRGHRLVWIVGQRAATTFATQAAFARSDPLEFLRAVGLLSLRRRRAVSWLWRRHPGAGPRGPGVHGPEVIATRGRL